MGVLMYIIAMVLRLAFSPILMVWGIIRRVHHGWTDNGFIGVYNALSDWFNELACAIDQFGNVLGMDTWNDLFAQDAITDYSRKERYPAGDRQQTISYFIGRNEHRGTLSRLGRFLNRILNFCEPDHARKALINGDSRMRNKVQNLDT